MKIVLLGPPGSGKGTLAEYLKEHLNIPHISTGDIFRQAIKDGTELGKLAKSLIDNGNFVPDSVTIDLVKERLSESDCSNGYILDGFPRNLEQGVVLNNYSKPDLVIYLDICLDEALKRLLNRRVCESCSATFNMLYYDKTTCQKCGGNLSVRKDDNEETIKTRFDIYNTVTKPLYDYYQESGEMRIVDVNKTIEEVRESINKLLGEFNA